MTETEPDQPGERRIDFGRLRREIEASVMLPEFGHVARRARKRRARTRLATLGTVALVVAILGPAGVVADLRQAGVEGWVSPPDRTTGLEPTTTATSSATVEVTVAAAAGVDMSHLYALVDVCVGDACSLQLSRLTPNGPAGKPLATNLLRSSPTASLDSVGLSAQSASSVVVRGLIDGDRWEYQPVDLTSNDAPQAQNQTPAVTTADRAVQLTRFGALQAVQARSGRPLQLPSQPPIQQPMLIDNVAPQYGLWVVGTRGDGQLAVSVSRDAGRTWTTQPLGLPANQVSGFDPPVFASYDGKTAYLLIRLANEEFGLFSTVDSGATWHRQPGQLPWPQPVPVGAPYGLVVRPDGSLLAWLSGSPTMTYLESTDQGVQFRVTSAGPGGPVYAVPGGYVELGTQPAISTNAATWARAQIAYAVPGG